MDTVTFKGLEFVPYLTREQIAEQVQRVAAEIRRDCKSENPIFLCVLNGAFMFAADLFRACQMNHAEITFIRFKSYEGTSSTGKVREIMGLSEDIEGRDVIIIEDIVDTGVTAFQLRQMLLGRNPRSVKMATLLFKPESLQLGTPPEYVGFEIPSKFIIGYGLDLDGEARNLSDIYVVK
ncbi:MAG: hypoxanthine phosphoribosyltransferase [Muribaculaceae bacterium]|nr:hypoxanthine phosphoribosyltransferase [Muribaculaceae bacterium]MBR6432576.1 hypoxanthine phosphoribosyltransferase [Muribaculaceae bacterium]